jgi:hypothetical protein
MMIDPLAERFFPLEDFSDDSDWLDVRRRARRGKPIVVIVVVAVAVVLAAAALAATNSWLFDAEHGRTTGETTVSLHGHTYAIELQLWRDGRYFGLHLFGDRAHTHELIAAYGGSILAAPNAPAVPLIPRLKPTGQAMFGMSYRVDGGEIWFGDARPEVAKIVVLDTRGHAAETATVAPPRAFKTAFRFWALALPSSYGRTIVAYDAHGALVDRRLLFPARTMTLN